MAAQKITRALVKLRRAQDRAALKQTEKNLAALVTAEQEYAAAELAAAEAEAELDKLSTKTAELAAELAE